MKRLEVSELVGAQELEERINNLLRLMEEEEAIEVTNRGKVIARVVPVQKLQSPGEQELTPFWEKMERLAAEIGTYLPGKVDAVEIVREGRRR